MYYYDDGEADQEPLYYTVTGTSEVVPEPSDEYNACDVNPYEGGGGSSFMMTGLTENRQACESLREEYDALIDGGDTNALLAQIAGTWHQEVADLRGQLLAIGPTYGRPVGSCPLRRGLLRGRVVRAFPTPADSSVSKPSDHQRIGAAYPWMYSPPFAGPAVTCRINCLGSITGNMMPLEGARRALHPPRGFTIKAKGRFSLTAKPTSFHATDRTFGSWRSSQRIQRSTRAERLPLLTR